MLFISVKHYRIVGCRLHLLLLRILKSLWALCRKFITFNKTMHRQHYAMEQNWLCWQVLFRVEHLLLSHSLYNASSENVSQHRNIRLVLQNFNCFYVHFPIIKILIVAKTNQSKAREPKAPCNKRWTSLSSETYTNPVTDSLVLHSNTFLTAALFIYLKRLRSFIPKQDHRRLAFRNWNFDEFCFVWGH